MTTKAELEQELDKLRLELSEMKSRAKKNEEDKAASSSEAGEPDVKRVLEDLGIDPEAAKDLGSRFLGEISTLQKEKPLVALLGAFVLGVVLGRMLK